MSISTSTLFESFFSGDSADGIKLLSTSPFQDLYYNPVTDIYVRVGRNPEGGALVNIFVLEKDIQPTEYDRILYQQMSLTPLHPLLRAYTA